VAHFAAARLIGRVLEFDHQLGRGGLVRVVAFGALGGSEGLALVRFLQVSIFGVVAVEAERRGGLGEMEAIFLGWLRTGFVGGVAGVAAHIERGVAAAFFRDIGAGLVALEAEIFLFAAGSRLEELIFVVRDVRVMAGEAVADRGRMNGAFDVRGGLVGMAGEAERGRRGGDELDAGYILIDADLMATETAGGHGGMHGLALGFVFVAFKALGGVGLGVERNRMDRGGGAHGSERKQGDT